MDGSNGKIIELLERIALGQERLNDRVDRIAIGLDETRDELRATRNELKAELKGLRGETRDGFQQVNGRLDNMLGFLGRYHGDHEQRITALETTVYKKRKA